VFYIKIFQSNFVVENNKSSLSFSILW